jgi:hypothetical protein
MTGCMAFGLTCIVSCQSPIPASLAYEPSLTKKEMSLFSEKGAKGGVHGDNAASL